MSAKNIQKAVLCLVMSVALFIGPVLPFPGARRIPNAVVPDATKRVDPPLALPRHQAASSTTTTTTTTRRRRIRTDRSSSSSSTLKMAPSSSSSLPNAHGIINGQRPAAAALTHRDICWKIRPHPDSPWTDQVYFGLATWLLHAYWQVTTTTIGNNNNNNNNMPVVLCPAGGLCQVEAWHGGQRVGRFGITTTPGPRVPLIGQQVQACFPTYHSRDVVPHTAAIQYMVVEPLAYRQRNLGTLALQVIAYIHAAQGADFTLLVADDNGSGKLVDWYQRRGGFQVAPLLQELLGSPNAQYGVAMVGPTNATLPADCRIEWW